MIIPVTVFNNKNLNVHEIRLLSMLYSKNCNLDGLNYKDKCDIMGKLSYTNTYLLECMSSLIACGLLNTDGSCINLKSGNIRYVNIDRDMLLKCKSLRQLFVECIPYIGAGSNVLIVSINTFKGLFPNKRSWYRVLSQSGHMYSWYEKHNKIYIPYGVSNTSENTFIDYTSYIHSDFWINFSKNLKEKIGKCQLCSNTQNLHVHHNTYENLGHEKEEDLVVLCSNCHKKFHGR